MTHLRKLMLEELERRNYSPLTTCAYLRAVDEFARYFKRLPTNSVRITSASIRRICSANESSHPTALPSGSADYGSSISRR